MIEYIEGLNKLKAILIEKESNYLFLKKINLPFIPDTNLNFHNSKNKVVIVGQETGAWGKERLDSFVFGSLTVEQLITESKNRYNKYYRETRTNSSFLRFINRVIKKNDQEDVQWLNFYMCAYENKSFNQLNTKKNNIDLYKEIKDFSIINLTNQLKFLQPKNILFLGEYHGNWPQLKSNYINEEEILNIKNSIKGFSLRFWNKDILVIRIPHPSSRGKDKSKIHEIALEYFRIFNEEANQDPSKFKQIIANDLIK